MTTAAAATATCGEACGWMAAICSALAFGTFGVPIKSDASTKVNIDPLVFQSYKTFMCFATSWLVLVAGEQFTFSPWGIVSGLFWVPGGVATIYAVKSAGLAIGIGIGSSFIVLVSFIWGIFVFDERVHSRSAASFAIFCMMMGLFGMSYYSSPQKIATASASHDAAILVATSDDEANNDDDDDDDSELPPQLQQQRGASLYRGVGSSDYDDGDEEEVDAAAIAFCDNHDESSGNNKLTDRTIATTTTTVTTTTATYSSDRYSDRDPEDALDGNRTDDNEHLPIVVGSGDGHADDADDNSPMVVALETAHPPEMEIVQVFGIRVSRRRMGMISAAFCGIWGGSIMAPMKFCKSDTKGTHYLMSFSIGASIVTIALWFLRYLLHVIQYRSLSKAYMTLPSFHLRVMWLAGGTSGLLWSIGNFFSLISVFYLGEGVGYPLVQTSILVSGLWGIFYFREVQGNELISKWFLSSLLTVFGILLLSYEHHEK